MDKPGAIIIEGHVQGLSNARSLGEIGIPVIVVDKTNCIARYSKYCMQFFYCPDFMKNEFIDFLLELAQSQNLKDWVLIPSNDHAVFSISQNKTKLEEYYKIISPEISILEKIYNKANLLNLATKINVPIPKTYYFTDCNKPENNLTFPIITKGRKGLSFYKTFGKKVFLANNYQELITQLNLISRKTSIEEVFSQELIPFYKNNKTISFTAFSEEGIVKTFWMGEKIREHPIRFGTATFCKSVYETQLLKLSRKLIKELNYTGACEIEFLKDPRDNKFKLIEINARTWLWVGLAKACGVDYAKIIYNYFHGTNNFEPTPTIRDAIWANYLTDYTYSLLSIFKKKLSIREHFNSYKGKVVKAVYSRDDKWPAIIYFIFLFKFLRKR